MRLKLALIIAFAILAVPATARTMPPKDECLGFDGYYPFRQELESIVKARDGDRLLALTSDTIEWSFGGDSGKTSFAAEWKLAADSAKSPIWTELAAMLPLGCGVQESLVAFPYMFTVGDPEGDDVFSTGVVTGSAVNLRKSPSARAETLARLSWEVVTYLDDQTEDGWTRIRAGTKEGYIRDDLVRSFVAYRAGFEHQNGQWRMIFFIAGD